MEGGWFGLVCGLWAGGIVDLRPVSERTIPYFYDTFVALSFSNERWMLLRGFLYMSALDFSEFLHGKTFVYFLSGEGSFLVGNYFERFLR